MRYLGVKTLSAESVIKAAEMAPISSRGCAELVSHCMRNVTSGINLRQLVEKPLWLGIGASVPVSLRALADTQTSLAADIVDSINAAGVTSAELGRMLKSAGLDEKSVRAVLPSAGIETIAVLPTPADEPIAAPVSNEQDLSCVPFDLLLPNMAPQSGNATSAIITSRSLPAWRGAEQYVALILGEHGYQVEDRSRQNLGYDLFVEKAGRKYYVEVKLLDYAGQPFIITTNEEVVARESGDAYIIALTLRGSDEGVHVQFVHDPTRALKFVRQCRQWVWECSEYEFRTDFQIK